jgi:hypothetical protein
MTRTSREILYVREIEYWLKLMETDALTFFQTFVYHAAKFYLEAVNIAID